MMIFIYNFIFMVGFLIASPYFLYKLIRSDKWREGLRMRLGLYGRPIFEKLKNKKTLWIHAASVGEVKAVLPLARKIQNHWPQYHVVLTTVTRTGNQLARRELGDSATVLYFPLDFFFSVSSAIRLIHPQIVILVESELWANFLSQLYRKKIPVALINVRMSTRAFLRYRKALFFVRSFFNDLSLITAPSTRETAKMILLGARPKTIHITGNLKYEKEEKAKATMEERLHWLKKLGFQQKTLILLAGSTHPGEEEILLGFYRDLFKEFEELRLVLAPRHPERADEIMKLVQEKGLKGCRRTQLPFNGNGSNTSAGAIAPSHHVLILDTIGELEKIYAVGDVVFIGKSLFKKGGQNFLEPAQFGKPIVFGPHMENFEDIADIFVRQGGALQVENLDELRKVLHGLLSSSLQREEVGKRAKEILLSQRGALENNFDLLEKILV